MSKPRLRLQSLSKATKLGELIEVGMDQFNIYLMSGDEERTLEVYGREIIPAFQ